MDDSHATEIRDETSILVYIRGRKWRSYNECQCSLANQIEATMSVEWSGEPEYLRFSNNTACPGEYSLKQRLSPDQKKFTVGCSKNQTYQTRRKEGKKKKSASPSDH